VTSSCLTARAPRTGVFRLPQRGGRGVGAHALPFENENVTQVCPLNVSSKYERINLSAAFLGIQVRECVVDPYGNQYVLRPIHYPVRLRAVNTGRVYGH